MGTSCIDRDHVYKYLESLLVILAVLIYLQSIKSLKFRITITSNQSRVRHSLVLSVTGSTDGRQEGKIAVMVMRLWFRVAQNRSRQKRLLAM